MIKELYVLKDEQNCILLINNKILMVITLRNIMIIMTMTMVIVVVVVSVMIITLVLAPVNKIMMIIMVASFNQHINQC